MAFYAEPAPVPAELRTGEFLVRMLRAGDVELDYDAVIASRPILLLRSSGRWPREGFTIAENLADLQGHEADHLNRTAFTYTVMNTAETYCLGCVYIKPLQALLSRLGAHESVGEADADVSFWVRPDHYAADLDRRLLAALREWFRDAWAFPRVVFTANAEQERDLAIFEGAGLERAYIVDVPSPPGRVFFYA